MIFIFWMLSFKPVFSLFSFTFIKRLFSSSLLSTIRVVSGIGFDFIIIAPLRPSHCDFFFVFGCGVSFFFVDSNVLLLMVVQQLAAILVFSQEISTCPYTLPSWAGTFFLFDFFLCSTVHSLFPDLCPWYSFLRFLWKAISDGNSRKILFIFDSWTWEMEYCPPYQ